MLRQPCCLWLTVLGNSCVAIGGSEECGLTNAAGRLVCPSLLVFWGLLKLPWTSRWIKAINYSCRICLLNAFDEFFMSPCWTVKSIHQPGLSEACQVPSGTRTGQWFLIFRILQLGGFVTLNRKDWLAVDHQGNDSGSEFVRKCSSMIRQLCYDAAGNCSRTSP